MHSKPCYWHGAVGIFHASRASGGLCDVKPDKLNSILRSVVMKLGKLIVIVIELFDSLCFRINICQQNLM